MSLFKLKFLCYAIYQIYCQIFKYVIVAKALSTPRQSFHNQISWCREVFKLYHFDDINAHLSVFKNEPV